MGLTPAVIEPLARAGFAVKGIVYLILGSLALMAALGAGGRVTDPRGAIASLLDEPFGRAMVGALAIGLALYAGWRFLEAFADANHVGRTRNGIGERFAWALSGAAYTVLALDVGQLAFRWDSGGGVGMPRTLLGSPVAPWVIALIGLAIIVYALKEMRRAFARRFSERLNLRRLSREAGPLVIEISRVGIIARAVVMVALGIVLLRARSTPVRAAENTDVGDSLRLVAALPSGAWLLTFIAAGLMAYGVYQLVHARYRSITPP